MSTTLRPFFFLFLLIFVCAESSAQTTSQTSFGKNRVQYHNKFDGWQLYETANFVTYWFGDARNIAQSALQTAELDFAGVQQMLEHQMSDKIEMLVFSDITDLKQSNIGEDDVFMLRAGETKVVGNKVFVYFDGDHLHLRAQIREGVAGVLLNAMLFGANIQEIVQNAVLLNLPGWYTNGLTAYCGEEWNPVLDNELRNVLQSGKYNTFDKLAKDNPRLAGHAFWYYISLHYGPGTVSNLLYLTRINRSIDAGFLYVLGNGYRITTANMLDYYRKRYRGEGAVTQMPEASTQVAVKNKKKLPLSQLKISPDGLRIAYVSNDIGKWRVYVQDFATGKRKRILKGGSRNALQATDYNYPLIAWNPDNQRLGVLYERRDVGHLVQIDLKTNKKASEILSPEYQRVFSMDYMNPGELVLSAMSKGYTDLFRYRISNRQTVRITQDFWDDLDASYTVLDGRRGILFASNRTGDTLAVERLDTILPLGHFDVFFFDLDNSGAELQRITNTPLFDERLPVGLDSSHFTFVSDANGISNRQVGFLETYTAYNQAIIYLKEGGEARALDLTRPGEWPIKKAMLFLVPLDTVLKNIDSLKIDSIRFSPVFKKRPRTWNQTNYDQNITQQHVAPRVGRLVQAVPRGEKTLFYTEKIAPETIKGARITRYRELTLRNAGQPIPPPPPLPLVPKTSDTLSRSDERILRSDQDTVVVVQPGWLFQVPEYLSAPAPAAPQVPRAPTKPVIEEIVMEAPADSVTPAPRNEFKATKPLIEFGKQNAIIRFNPPQIQSYRLRFRTDYISTTMDNNLLFEGLERYDSPQDRLRTPPPGILLKANFKDLLEDYVIEAGFRLPTTFNGMEYYLWFDDKKRRLDRRMLLYRRTVINNVARNPIPPAFLSPDYQERTNTLMAQYELRYPLDVFTSLRATGSLRQDRSYALSSDPVTLEIPSYSEQRASLRLAAIFDNTVDVDLNLKTGTRAKVWVEAVKRFEFNTDPTWKLKLNSGFMTVIGWDGRHYQMLDRRSILALRLAGATSFGSERMLYVLGGVDNWLFPKFNGNIPLPQDDGFAYQSLATNVRGFNQNIRNGSSYALVNAELRVPIFKYFSNKPVMGNFWRNFQLVGFFDTGTAWQGISPYRGDNPTNTVILPAPTNPPSTSPVTVKVNYFRDPLVAGYGVGVRTVLFGMYLRADYAWGIETKVVQKPVLHLALGTDF